MDHDHKKVDPLDKELFSRWFHLHCFTHIFKMLFSKNPKHQFAYPRFKLFEKIKLDKQSKSRQSKKKNNYLFKSIVFTYLPEIIIGALITIFFSCLNLLIPLLIKSFLKFMHDHDVDKQQISSTQLLIEGFILLQLMRIIFGQHSKRLFFELAIKIQSSLALKIVKKSLRISHEIRSKISQSQILHLENIDLKLVFIMFQNTNIAIQAPFTIIVAIFMLYLQNYKYGLIGIYWFIIAFLLQRELDNKLTHCNDTKLGLIQARSKINYEIFGKIRVARILGFQQFLTQKNNDYFIEQNHDHKKFYQYITLYDITLILLPILVIVTIALYDLSEPDQISVHQVYVLLSLLGICYNPMKSFRNLSIYLHDGMRSLNRIQQFLNHQDQSTNQKIKLNYLSQTLNSSKLRKINLNQSSALLKIHRRTSLINNEALLIISKNLQIEQQSSLVPLKLIINLPDDIQLFRNERLYVVGKVGSGVQSFVQALIGTKKILKGTILLNDKIAYLGQQYFFRNTSIRENIRFFNSEVSNEQIQSVYKLLKLDEDLKLTQGLEGNVDDEYKYSRVQLHKISLARVFCSNADIYLLDRVFQPLNHQDSKLVNQILRKKKEEGKLIILINDTNNFFQKDHKILLIDKGEAAIYSTFADLIESKNEQLKNFFNYKTIEKQKQEKQSLKNEKRDNLIKKVQRKVSLLQRVGSLIQKNYSSKQNQKKFQEEIIGPTVVYAMWLLKEYNKKQHTKISSQKTGFYIYKFLTAVKFKQFVYIFFIIAVAQLMHIFIHFYIGHLEEEHGQNNYVKFKNMIIIQTLLTLGLCGVIYLEGQFSSYIAIIQGNYLYKNALSSLGQNKLSWFLKEYSVKIANRFNHDYEEVFIALHMFLNIYKNLVILIATIFFLSQSTQDMIKMGIGIFIAYFAVYFILRKVEKKVVHYYQEYKYHYVRVLQESVGGAKLINLYGASQQVIKNAKKAYLQSASYKIAESYTSYGEEIFCDIVSLVIFSYVLHYGLQSKAEGNSKSIALIATMIHLLMGVFDVLKTIVKDSVNFQTFFKINLLPFVQVIKEKTPQTLEVQHFIQKSIIQYEQSRSSHSIEQNKKSKLSFSSSNGKQQNQQQIGSSLTQQDLLKKKSSSQLKSFNGLGPKRTSSLEMDLNFLKTHEFPIHFNNVLLHQSKYHEPVFQVYPLNIKIQAGQKVLFWETNDNLKNYLAYGLTKNLPMLFNPQIMAKQRTAHQIRRKQKTILIGDRDICCIQKSQLEQIVQIIMDHDFFIQGTLQDNISWKNPKYNQQRALILANFLRLQQQLPEIKNKGMKVKIQDPTKQTIKKMTFLRILSLQPKIIIIKDTDSIIGHFKIVSQITKLLGGVTIIKISSNIQEAFDVDRIIYTKNFKLIEDRSKNKALTSTYSAIGQQLRKANIQGHVYMNEMTSTLANIRYILYLSAKRGDSSNQ